MGDWRILGDVVFGQGLGLFFVFLALDIDNFVELFVDVAAIILEAGENILGGRQVDLGIFADFFLQEADCLDIIRVIAR